MRRTKHFTAKMRISSFVLTCSAEGCGGDLVDTEWKTRFNECEWPNLGDLSLSLTCQECGRNHRMKKSDVALLHKH